MVLLITRAVNIPSFFHIGRGKIANIQQILKSERVEVSRAIIVSGKSFTRSIGDVVERSLGGDLSRVHIEDNEIPSIEKVEKAIIDFAPSLMIGVGGGKVLDVTKFCARKLNKPFLAIPTALSNDGISSPISVVHTDHGIRSIGTNPPIGIIVDTEVIKKAPRETILAGIGDLISNISAVDDWNLAGRYNGEKVDKFAEILARNSAEGFVQSLMKNEDMISILDDQVLISLAEGLIQSGIAMSLAGSSRPCSGSEHLISHALDQLLNFDKPHGLQVGLATLFSCALQLKDVSELITLYQRIGLPSTPLDLGISTSTFLEAIKQAPHTRKDRFTILNLVSENDVQEAIKTAYGIRNS